MTPPLTHDGLSYCRLFALGAFGQRRLVSASDLSREAIRRRMPLDRFRPSERLEQLDQRGAFGPICFSRSALSLESTFLRPDPDSMVFREEHSFRPWQEHGTLDAGHHGVREKYSLWQLLYLGEALSDDWPIPIDVLEGPATGLLEWREGWRKWLDRAASDHVSLDAQWRPLVKLLVALETCYWREVSGSFSPLMDVASGEQVDPLTTLPEELTPSGLADHFKLTPDDVEYVHRWLALRAVSIDPMPEWYVLARHAARRRYELLRGVSPRPRATRSLSGSRPRGRDPIPDPWLTRCRAL